MGNGKPGDKRNGGTVDGNRTAGLVQSVPVAFRAGPMGNIRLHLLPGSARFCFQISFLKIWNDTFERFGKIITPFIFFKIKRNFLVAGPIKKDLFEAVREVFERGINIGLIVTGQGIDELEKANGVAVLPGEDSAFTNGQFRIRYDQVRVEFGGQAETVASRAGALR